MYANGYCCSLRHQFVNCQAPITRCTAYLPFPHQPYAVDISKQKLCQAAAVAQSTSSHRAPPPQERHEIWYLHSEVRPLPVPYSEGWNSGLPCCSTFVRPSQAAKLVSWCPQGQSILVTKENTRGQAEWRVTDQTPPTTLFKWSMSTHYTFLALITQERLLCFPLAL